MTMLKSITAHRTPRSASPRPSGFPAAPTPRETALGQTSTPSRRDRKSTRLNSSHGYISYAVFCLKKKKKKNKQNHKDYLIHKDIQIRLQCTYRCRCYLACT